MAADDLVAIWEAHCRYEFETYDVDATMTTMVAEPYVNNIPTMTGGVGQDAVRHFYKNHFVGDNPPDTTVVPVSRTVGADCIVDELIFCFTHTTPIDWMLPGIAPTGRRVEVPLVAVVKFRDGKIAHEHIHWDQASVLVQIGMLDPRGLPVVGIETARKTRRPELAEQQAPRGRHYRGGAAAKGIEHVPEKLNDFSDKNMLQLFDFERCLADLIIPSGRKTL